MKKVKELTTMVVYTPSKQQKEARRKWRQADPKSAHSVWAERHLCW